jgi:alkylhydroperoxidase/carboxymuconolactone decarboxylase family protein YurZ
MKKSQLTENAVKHHEELFPNHKSKLQKTDPEFIELFDNWAFDEVIRQSKLDTKTRVMLTFAMLISLGRCEPQVKGHVTGNLKVGNDRTRLVDVVTQLLPYIGYPRTLNALRVIGEVVPPTNIASAASTAHWPLRQQLENTL